MTTFQRLSTNVKSVANYFVDEYIREVDETIKSFEETIQQIREHKGSDLLDKNNSRERLIAFYNKRIYIYKVYKIIFNTMRQWVNTKINVDIVDKLWERLDEKLNEMFESAEDLLQDDTMTEGQYLKICNDSKGERSEAVKIFNVLKF